MVSQDSPQNQAQNMLHQFILSDNISGQNQHFDDAYESAGLRSSANNKFPHSLPLLPNIHSFGETMSSISMEFGHVADQDQSDDQINHSTHLMDLLGSGNHTHQPTQRSSLSLAASHMFILSTPYKPFPGYHLSEEHRSEACNLGVVQHVSDDTAGSSYASSSTSLNRSHATQTFTTLICHSKYLKPAQCLLEEVVNVGGKDVDMSSEKFVRKLHGIGSCRGGFGVSSKCTVKAEKHQVEMKTVTQLVGLLEEVEERWEKYLEQMEEVVSSFEVTAGSGAAKCYIGLAVEAMAKHFGILRDGIMCEINVRRRPRNNMIINAGFSKLSLCDRDHGHSLQRLVMIQSQRHQAWRPIRALLETSVAILRSWLFEHFLNPYPTDSEKLLLASQTGLTKNQVSNWFINARVRLWKPMIEEMYREEFAGSSHLDSIN